MIFLLFFLAACNGRKEETPVIPPLTSPLSGSFIGYGVINVSYTRVIAAPEEDSLEGTDSGWAGGPGFNGPDEGTASGNASGSYLRQGSVVRILQRRQVKNQDKLESWVQVDGHSAGSASAGGASLGGASAGSTGLGWLRESLVDIYDSEAQALTASESMGR